MLADHYDSRLKKVKCIQAAQDSPCEACALARVPCRFKDREKYFAERRRIMSGTSSSDGSRRQSPAIPEAQLESWIPPSTVGCGITPSSLPHFGRSSPATMYAESDAMVRASYSGTPPQQHRSVRGNSTYNSGMSVPFVPSQHWYVPPSSLMCTGQPKCTHPSTTPTGLQNLRIIKAPFLHTDHTMA